MDVVLQQFGEQNVVGFILVLARVSPLFVLAPLFNSRLIPARVRGIVAVALAVGLSPVLVKGHHLATDPAELVWLAGKEMLIGLAFAFVVGALFAAVTVAGSFLDSLIGFSYGSLVDPLTGTQSSILQQAYSLVAILVFIAIGGDGWMVRGLARTYDVVPLDRMPSLTAMVQGVDTAFVSIFLSAIQVAGPVLLAIVLTDAAFGLVSRVMPQLNVFGVGFPAKVMVGLLLIGVSLPFVAAWLGDGVQGSISDALRALKVA
ncbi:MAG TPA: flagellar biosynthetic protein FliR [Gaiellales bacterium]|nr:flagellar biosynthetic protein FliR [Gaiellales bacterium]